MPDDMDQAQAIAARQQEEALARWREQQTPMPVTELDCRDCGEPIEAARRRASPDCRRCVDCQREHEARRRWK